MPCTSSMTIYSAITRNHGDRDRFRVDIRTDIPYLLHDRLQPTACGFGAGRCIVTRGTVTTAPRAATRIRAESGSFTAGTALR